MKLRYDLFDSSFKLFARSEELESTLERRKGVE